MAYADPRSCRRDLHAGMTDGAYKTYAPNRGGILEDTTAAVRRQMSSVWHGFACTDMKILPDGRTDHPPYYSNVNPVNGEY